MTRLSALKLSLIMASSWSACAMAQDAPQEPQADDGAAIIVTGTRAVGMSAADSAAPVQVLGEAALAKVGQPNLNQALTQIVPSFTAQTQGTDMSNFALSARLRGLSPNHTLVMVNGKRRHGSSILQVIAGPFQGSAAPSIDLIPPDAVDHIEILQDGAAAQYGTDAIAGVINLILKDENEGGSFKVTGGQYYDSEGELWSVSGNAGFKLGEDGFFNVTAFHRRQDYTTTGTGQVQITKPDGTLQPNTPAQWSNLTGDALSGINGGQAKSELSLLFYNMGYDFGGIEFYSFGDISRRIGYAKQGYRHPSRICNVPGNRGGSITTAAYDPSLCLGNTGVVGMVPQQKVEQDEYSITGGVRGDVADWNYDFGVTYGSDKNQIYTIDSANRSLYQNTGFTPTDFYDGMFKLTQLTTTLDIRKEFDAGLAGPLTFAFGGEYRREKYTIGAGDEGSTYLEGGQSFPGYQASDAGTFGRHVKAVYANVILEPVDRWTVDLAGRYEDYSDFGDTKIGKITTRYDFNDAIAIRGTASTGFRAPTLQEGNYSATNVSPTGAVLQLPPSSTAAQLLGFSALKPEKSTNFSAGIVLRPIPKLAVTLDGYYIKIKDRIAGTAQIRGTVNGVIQPGNAATGVPTGQQVLDAIAARGVAIDNVPNLGVATFTNGVDTRTMGLDFAASYPVMLDFGRLDLSLSANYTKTKVTKNRIPGLFSAQSVSYLEDASPDYKIGWGGLFTSGKFSLNVRETFYGSSSVLVFPAISGAPSFTGVVKAAAITDLEAGYDFTDSVTISVGANNLFNKRPEVPKLLTGYTIAPGVSPYVNGSTTYNSPYGHGAYGSSGGYYYARIDFKF
ncbi:TonB-dependent receptor [Sphingobium lactosutens]|uniref:TonB-dependent receptor plug domain-containing protein n=1 Tax=Sphingobium lactosutens TaxID=522773 RepID=UPI0015BEE41C|nr:TonB-dependent receptor [Sphingobium lactosutens]NWK95457.1 TonB-dependent receptor [Sphingobium lactosutens]